MAIREFARNIVRISALADGRRVVLEKVDKHTWRAPASKLIELAYEVRVGSIGASRAPR